MPLTALPHRTFVTRTFGPSTNSKGTITRGTESAGTVKGSLSAATPSDIALLEEGKRSRQCYKLMTTSSLQVAKAGGLVPAQVQIGSDWYEIANENPWQNNVMNHYEFLITKIENP
jgi:hypothetical protein